MEGSTARKKKELLKGSFRIVTGGCAKRRQLVRGSTASQDSKGYGSGKGLRHPCSEAGPCGSAVAEQDKKDEGTQDLSLVLCGTPCSRIKARDEIRDGIKVKAQEFPALFFIGLESVLGVS